MTMKNNTTNNQSYSFQSLKGQLLVAMPGIDDLRFNKTVIYIFEHSQETGAKGIVITAVRRCNTRLTNARTRV